MINGAINQLINTICGKVSCFDTYLAIKA